MTTRRGAAFVFAACIALGACRPDAEIEVAHAYLERPLPGTQVSAGYFEIRNHGDAPVTLTGADSAAARKIELHEHVLDGDMMRRREVASVAIAPGERIAFAPGGRHLMIFDVDLAKPPVVIRFTFADHAPIAVEFAVHDRTGGSG